MKIPNRLVLVLLAGYLAMVPFSGLSLQDIAWSAAAAAVVFAFGVAAFACRVMGGGDVKLLAVAALWLGAANVLPFVFYTAIFGAVLTILLLLFRAIPLPAIWRDRDWILRLHAPDTAVPYGVAIAAAAVPVFLRSPWAMAAL